MTSPNGDFAERLTAIKRELIHQGARVLDLVERGFEAFFASDADKAKAVIDADEPIDEADLAIEGLAIDLLMDAARESNELSKGEVRLLLVIVKVNNELERIADAAVDIAEQIDPARPSASPPAFRVLTNSVVGIIRDAVASMDRGDPQLAKLVLQSEDCVREFRDALLKESEKKIASGELTIDQAFTLQQVASYGETMADHATNVAEQIIYATTGTVVRHSSGKWVEVPRPGN